MTDAASPGPYETRICKGMPADCCDYGVISLTTGKEVCRVWTEADARMIAAALQPSPAREEAEALVKRLRAPHYWLSGSDQGHEGDNDAPLDAAAFIARHHLGRQA